MSTVIVICIVKIWKQKSLQTVILSPFFKWLFHEDMKDMTHNFCHFPSLDGKEIDCALIAVFVNNLSIMHDGFHTSLEDILQLNNTLIVNFLQTMIEWDVMDQPEYVHIELCEAIVEKHLIKATGKKWLMRGHTAKHRILYEKGEPFIFNLPMSNLTENGFSILLH